MPDTKQDIWTNRFVEPKLEDLLGRLPKASQSLLDSARTHLSGEGTIAETVCWMDAPFNWCMVYEAPGAPEPLWYLVPAEESPFVVVRVDSESAKTLFRKRISRMSRDALRHTTEVGGIRWVELELSSQAQLKELKTFLGVISAGSDN